MAKSSVISPYQKFWNVNIPLSAGTATFYNTGTNNLAAVFSDPDQKIPQVNPYTLDAGGRIRGDLRFSAVTRLELHDSNGVLIDTIPNVTCFDDGAVFADYSDIEVYGAGGNNIVTASNGGYYVSRVDDNLDNDPVTSSVEWQQIFFFPGTTTLIERLEQISLITPTNQSLIVADGTDWEGQLWSETFEKFLTGLTTSNNVTDAEHDIDVSPGSCNDSTDAIRIVLPVTMTKRIDAIWAAGNGAGGLASGATLGASTWYHLFIVLVDGTVDAMFDSSPICANGVANNEVTNFRRIGSVLTDPSSNIVKYFQFGDRFIFDVARQTISTVTATAANVTISAPLGVETTLLVYAQLALISASGTGVVFYMSLTSPDYGTPTVSATQHQQAMANPGPALDGWSCTLHEVKTNTSSQIKARGFATVGTSLGSVMFNVIGWIDTRNQ